MRFLLGIGLIATMGLLSPTAFGQTVAFEDFDGGALNLTSGFDPGTENIDGGGGDFYGVGSLGAWPQQPDAGAPFSLADDSVVGVSAGTFDPGDAFTPDLEGIFGQNASPTNNFFSISDARDATAGGPLTSSWTFDTSSASLPDLLLSIDMGQQSDGDAFGGLTVADLLFEYSLDGGAFETAFALTATDATGTGFSYRAMDGGATPTATGVMVASGPGVEKIEADTGLVSSNLFLNKTPASGPGAGLLDTFQIVIDGGGSASELEFRLTTTSLEFEAFAFDNIRVTAIPEPGTLGLVAMLGSGMVLRRRRR